MEIPKPKSADDWFSGNNAPRKPKRPRRRSRPGTKTADPMARTKSDAPAADAEPTSPSKPRTRTKPRKIGRKTKIDLDQVIGNDLPEPDLDALQAALEPKGEPEPEKPAVPETRDPADHSTQANHPKEQAGGAGTDKAPKASSKPTPKPKKKYYGKAKSGLAPAEQSAALAEAMVGSFVERLKAECQKKGALTVDDVEALSKEFERKTGALQQAFQASFEETIRAHKKVTTNDKRRDAFERVMAHAIAPLLVADQNKPKPGKTLSRRVMPGFFIALDKMLGEDAIQTFRNDMRALVDQVRDDNGDAFDWGDIYASVEAQNIALKAQITAAHHFINLKHRRDWLVTLINDNLGPVTPVMHKAHANWTFGNRDFRAFTLAFFQIMSDTLATEGGRMRITRMYGVDTIVVLADLLQSLHKKAGS